MQLIVAIWIAILSCLSWIFGHGADRRVAPLNEVVVVANDPERPPTPLEAWERVQADIAVTDDDGAIIIGNHHWQSSGRRG